MKKTIFQFAIVFILLTVNLVAANLGSYVNEEDKLVGSEKELFILLTSGDKDLFTKLVVPYLSVSSKSWEKRTLLIWGPSEKTISENVDLKELITKLKEGGVVLKACKWCAEQYKVADILASLGFEVAYMGTPLTEALQGNVKVMTF